MTPFLAFGIAPAFPGPEGARCDGVPLWTVHCDGCWPTRVWASWVGIPAYKREKLWNGYEVPLFIVRAVSIVSCDLGHDTR